MSTKDWVTKRKWIIKWWHLWNTNIQYKYLGNNQPIASEVWICCTSRLLSCVWTERNRLRAKGGLQDGWKLGHTHPGRAILLAHWLSTGTVAGGNRHWKHREVHQPRLLLEIDSHIHFHSFSFFFSSDNFLLSQWLFVFSQRYSRDAKPTQQTQGHDAIATEKPR